MWDEITDENWLTMSLQWTGNVQKGSGEWNDAFVLIIPRSFHISNRVLAGLIHPHYNSLRNKH